VSDTNRKQKVEAKIAYLVKELLNAIQEHHRITEKDAVDVVAPVPIPPPPPPPPPAIITPRIITPESLVSSPRIPKTTKDPRKQLHDELKNGKMRLRVISVQRSASGTPVQTEKIPQIVTMNDFAMEQLRKKFQSQQEE
jgi:hypothetical protein